MSEEQDNQMEQWLEEYAKKRRNELDEPIEMHEATRTMLQGEVSRVYAKPVVTRPEPQGSSVWMAWAIGGATVGVAAIVITFNSNLPQGNPSMELAKADEAKPAAVGGSERVAESGKASGEPVSKSTETGKTQTATIRDNEEGNAPARRVVAAAVSADDKDNRASSIVEGSPGGAPIETTRAVTSKHTIPKKLVAGGFTPHPVNALKQNAVFYNNFRDLRQDFTQTNLSLANRQNDLPKAVLMNFRVQRIGNLVDVVDQDGSEYTGIVITEKEYNSVTEDKAVPARLLPAANAGADVSRAPAEALRSTEAQRGRASREQFYFRVQGFNLTLGKEVVLKATLDSPPEKPIEAGKLTASKLKSEDRAKENKQTQKAAVVKKELSDQKLQAIHAIAPMRVSGNAWIEKANYAVDAYQQQLSLPAKAMIKPAPTKPAAREK